MNTQEKVNKILAMVPNSNRDELIDKKMQMIKLQLQELGDYIDGGITSYNMKEVRNTYVINAQDSLDDSYPFYVHFNIIGEMTKIVSVWLDFWIMNYRAYSTAAASGGGDTSGSGGKVAISSGSGGGYTATSQTEATDLVSVEQISEYISVTNVGNEKKSGYLVGSALTVGVADGNHTHKVSIPNHNHSISIDNHTHSTPDHTHDVTYGIHEEDNSPAVKFTVSNNEGNSYSDIYGPFKENQSAIDITNDITGSGSKLVKFESTARARLSVQITVKLDIKAR
jgi:hypothetical protein